MSSIVSLVIWLKLKKNLSWVSRLSPLMQSPADIEACHNFSGDLAPASPYWLHLHPLAIPPFTSPWISRTLAPPVNQPGPDGPNMAHGSRWPQYGTCGPCEPSPLPSACTLWVKDLTHSTNQPFALFLEPSHSDTQSLFIWLRLRKPLVPWQLVDLNSQLDPKAARGLNSLCPLHPSSHHDSPFCCCSLCLLLTSKVAPLNIANCHWSNTETVIKSNNRPPPSLSSHIPKMWIPAIFLATLFPFCMLGFLLTSKAPLPVPTLIQVSLLKTSNSCQTRLKQRPRSVKNGVF